MVAPRTFVYMLKLRSSRSHKFCSKTLTALDHGSQKYSADCFVACRVELVLFARDIEDSFYLSRSAVGVGITSEALILFLRNSGSAIFSFLANISIHRRKYSYCSMLSWISIACKSYVWCWFNKWHSGYGEDLSTFRLRFDCDRAINQRKVRRLEIEISQCCEYEINWVKFRGLVHFWNKWSCSLVVVFL